MFMSHPPAHQPVIDGFEFASAGATQQGTWPLRDFPRLLVTRTFSKAYALAGLRVGYAHSSPDVIAVLERLRESFNVNGLALAAAQAALADRAHLAQVLARTEAARTRLFSIAAAHGVAASPSATNFVLWDFGRDARPIEAALFNAGVLSLAVVMLTWHNVWMARHGRELAAEMRAVGEAVAAGQSSLFALAVVVGVAVLR